MEPMRYWNPCGNGPCFATKAFIQVQLIKCQLMGFQVLSKWTSSSPTAILTLMADTNLELQLTQLVGPNHIATKSIAVRKPSGRGPPPIVHPNKKRALLCYHVFEPLCGHCSATIITTHIETTTCTPATYKLATCNLAACTCAA